jgi:hypothetical protein
VEQLFRQLPFHQKRKENKEKENVCAGVNPTKL